MGLLVFDVQTVMNFLKIVGNRNGCNGRMV